MTVLRRALAGALLALAVSAVGPGPATADPCVPGAPPPAGCLLPPGGPLPPLLPPGPTERPVTSVGIADQTPSLFGDKRFRALGVRPVRLVVTWDVQRNPIERAGADRWLALARSESLDVLVAFGRNVDRSGIPSSADYGRAVREFVAAHPEVHTYASWNEANLCSSLLCHRPGVAARYYGAVRAACPACRVIAGELVAAPPIRNLVEAGRYARALRRAAHVRLGLWALHAYTDANRFQTRWTRRAARSMPGEIWLDEVGGMVHRPPYRGRKPRGYQYPASVERSARVLRFIFTRLVRASPRITRVYVYQWDSGVPDQWDSALVGREGERPGLGEVRAAVGRARAAGR